MHIMNTLGRRDFRIYALYALISGYSHKYGISFYYSCRDCDDSDHVIESECIGSDLDVLTERSGTTEVEAE